MSFEEICKYLLVFLLGILATVRAQHIIDSHKSKKKAKISIGYKNHLRLQWRWAKAHKRFCAFAFPNIWYQNLSELGVTLKRIIFKSADHDQEVDFSIKIDGGMPSIEARSSPKQIRLSADCCSSTRSMKNLPKGKGVMILEIEDANGDREELLMPYEFIVSNDLKGPDDL